DAFADYLADRFRGVGADVTVVPNSERGNHVIARYAAPNAPADAKPALILCHFDTVWPVGSLATHPFRVDEEGKAYGPGIFDMQSSLALSEFALRAVADLKLDLPRPVTVLMTSDEEVGSKTSWELIEEEAKKSAYVLVMESPLPGGVIKTSRKGGGGFTIEAIGRAAHAGVEPERGINAIVELAHQVIKLHAMNDFEKGSSVSCGVIEGGTVTNVVPARAKVRVDCRIWTKEEGERIEALIKGLQPVLSGAELNITGGWNRPPLERKVTGEIYERAKVIAGKLGQDLVEGATGGGSDGNITGALGIPTLDGLGVPGHGAHADHEHIETDKIGTTAARLVAFLFELLVVTKKGWCAACAPPLFCYNA
ncbi:MAG: M20 family metallopeptidase, partial [Caldilineaceae bacterium]|nr:M20 family metallopeptidase [Caldilineaceae bacterium]